MTQDDLSKLRIDRSQEVRTRSARRGPGLGRWLFLVLLVAAGWVFRRPLSAKLDAWTLPQVELAEAYQPEAAAVAVQGVAANGYVVARKRAALSSEEPGRIVELLVEEGSVVEEGAVVARLFAEEREAALEAAAAACAEAAAGVEEANARLAAARVLVDARGAQVAGARSDVEAAEAARQLAQAERARVEGLVGTGAETQSRLDQAKAEDLRTKAALAAARAGVESAEAARGGAQADVRVAEAALERARALVPLREAERDRAQAALEKLVVRAPFAGVIVLKDAEVGEVVSPNSQGASSRGAVATLVDFDSLEVQVELPESNIAAVELGAPATLVLDAWPRDPYLGTVDRVWPTANRQKATIEVRLSFQAPDQRLRPDMGVRVVFGATPPEPSGQAPEGIALAKGAIVRQGGQDGVFLYERGTVRFQAIELGASGGASVTVLSGVEAGDLAVLDPPADLKDGDRVLADQ